MANDGKGSYWTVTEAEAPAWSPLSLSGLRAWYDASYGLYQERTGASATTPASSDGDPVGTWLDKSGNANHATAATDAKRPLLKLLPESRIRFDASDDGLLTGLNITGAQSLVLVANSNGAAGSYRLIASVGANKLMALRRADLLVYFGADMTVVRVDDNDPHTLIATKGVGDWLIYLDGADVTTVVNATDFGEIALGHAGAFAETANADYAAVLIFDAALTAQNISDLTTWGLSL